MTTPPRADQSNYLVSRSLKGTFTTGVLATMSSMNALRASEKGATTAGAR
ncbi:MAG: hypothetical protein ACYCPT_01020 [Acidimicrobiales bacterium]